MLATDFWQLAHYDRTGQPRLNLRGIQYGAAAGMLGELIFSRHVQISDNKFVVAGMSTPPPSDASSHLVLSELRAEDQNEHSVRTWLSYLGLKAPKWVTNRMELAHQVQPVRASWLRGGAVTYMPINRTEFAMVRGTLSHCLSMSKPLPYEYWCLAALAWATGLSGKLLDGAPPEAHGYLEHIVANLSTGMPEGMPKNSGASMFELIQTTQSAIVDATMTSR